MKTITSIVFIISFSIFSFAQPNRDKIKTLKIAFITEKLDLSEKEAQQFWPVYNAFEEEHFKLRRQSFNGKKNINGGFETRNISLFFFDDFVFGYSEIFNVFLNFQFIFLF